MFKTVSYKKLIERRYINPVYSFRNGAIIYSLSVDQISKKWTIKYNGQEDSYKR